MKEDRAHRHAVFDAAARIVDGERQEAYGGAFENFADIAAMATVILRPLLKEGAALTPEHVARLMIATKLSRITHSPTFLDHWVDIVGYAALGFEVACEGGEKKERLDAEGG